MATPIETLRKVETYALLIVKYAGHAQMAGEGSMREHFMEKARESFVLLYAEMEKCDHGKAPQEFCTQCDEVKDDK